MSQLSKADYGLLGENGARLPDGTPLSGRELPDIAVLNLASIQGNDATAAENPLKVVEKIFDYGDYGKLKTFAYQEGDIIYPPGAGGIMEMDLDILPLNNVEEGDQVTSGGPSHAFKTFKYRLCNELTEAYPHPIFGKTYPLDERHNVFHDWCKSSVPPVRCFFEKDLTKF